VDNASKPDLGIYYEMLRKLPPQEPALSFLSKDWPVVEDWRREARLKIIEQMHFSPGNTPLNPSVHSTKSKDGIVLEEVSYDMPYGPRTRGHFLYPDGAKGLPTVLALHDHGGFYYYGSEKIVDAGLPSQLLEDFKIRHYGGRSWATELAKKGFAVLAVDSFLWGSRKIPLHSINSDYLGAFEGLLEGSDEFILAYNQYWDTTEARITMSTVLNAGTTWPGILFYEDQRSIDYLQSRAQVDPKRIACGGLSGGGLRSVFLTGLEPRIKAGFTVGWMSTLGPMLRNHVQGHDLVMYVPHLLELLDIPDVMALHAPAPILALYDREDGLFPPEGQMEAHRKLTRIYQKMGYPDNYVGKFYPGLHKFDVPMQEDAFAWLEQVL
jgi:dienelactone hydrolase